MILRRLAAAIRRQDWFLVALEIAIVVVGILIALQVDNWNEARKARAQGEQWRQQIIADLRQSQRDMQGRLVYNRQALEFGETALAGLEASERPQGDAVWPVVLGAFQAGQIWPFRLTGPTFREAQNAGGLALVGHERAQRALAYYYDVSAHDYELVSGGLPAYRQMIRERLDWSIQSHIWSADCQSTVGAVGQGENDQAFILVACDPPADRQAVEDALDALRADVELQRSLRGRLSQLEVSQASTSRQIKRAEAVIALLRAPHEWVH